jgi:ACDE family multidrug resistance protein
VPDSAAPNERIIPVPGYSDAEAAGIIVAAVDASPIAGLVAEAAARMAAESGRAVHVVHAREAAIGGDVGVDGEDGEDLDEAKAVVRRHLDQLAAHRVPAEGQLLLHATDHGAAGRMIADYANAIGASTVVIGAPTHGGLPALVDGSSSRELLRLARSDVLIVNPAGPAHAALPVAAETAGAR